MTAPVPRPLQSVLIANRGEIACRISRTARRMGMRVIAVYSEADAGTPHVRAADVAYCIGPPAASESYLRIDKVLDVARRSGAESIHPGYGFLSENAEFAETCAKADIVFIGPSATAIRAMGLKDGAKALMQKAGVPVVPGYHGNRQEVRFLKEKAYEIGYPVLIKAVAGGGGKGMRRVDRHADFDAALEGAQREALGSFGNSHVLIEKYIDCPRHIEMQVFGDKHGNAVHLFERDCSLQRRHQKVIEEAPAPGMTEAMRSAMGAAAVAAAKAVAYAGAGTIEFIVDGSGALRADGFYFMEMNTRLQVEHPVTEAITGIDLVEWQFRVAAGEPLPLRQEEITCTGHAVEARLYAEDPQNGFMPSSGKLWALQFPGARDGLRVDSGVEAGGVVTPYYDPMIAKIIAHAPTRAAALDSLAAALGETLVAGPRCNAAFLQALCLSPGFRAGDFDTGYIGRNADSLGTVPQAPDPVAIAAGLQAALLSQTTGAEDANPWDARDAFQLYGKRSLKVTLRANDRDFGAELLGGLEGPQSLIGLPELKYDGSATTMLRQSERPRVFAAEGTFLVLHDGQQTAVQLVDRLDAELASQAPSSGALRSPMHGKLIAVFVELGARVVTGERIAIVEAMKMEHALLAPHDGVVSELAGGLGQQIAQGALIALIEADAETKASA